MEAADRLDTKAAVLQPAGMIRVARTQRGDDADTRDDDTSG